MLRMTLAESKLERLNRLLARLWNSNRFYATQWRAVGLSPQPLESLEQLARFPLTTREELRADLENSPPWGSNLTFEPEKYHHFSRSSGTSGQPLVWLDDAANWRWLVRCSRDLFRIAGVNRQDGIILATRLTTSLGGWTLRAGALRAGAWRLVLGAIDEEESLHWLRTLRPSTLVIRPERALVLARAAAEMHVDPRACGVRRVITTGAPGGSDPTVRAQIEQLWQAECFDRYGLTEAGPIAAECAAHPGGMHLLDEQYVAEVLHPGSSEPVADEEPGELVLTNLGRIGRPVVRYRTGDLVRCTSSRPCRCGRFAPLLLGGIRRIYSSTPDSDS